MDILELLENEHGEVPNLEEDPVGHAEFMVRLGEPIPLDVAVTLVGLGIDLNSLEKERNE